MVFDFDYGTIHMHADFELHLNIFLDNSGSGKTFFFEALNEYLKSNKKSCLYVSAESWMNVDMFANTSKMFDVIILDKADLYLTTDILNKFMQKSECIICSLKNIDRINVKYGLYKVEYSNNSLEVHRFG